MATNATKLVRINPEIPRDLHIFEGYQIRKDDGWVELPADVAARAEKEPLSDLTPTSSPKVFEVKSHAEARVIAEAEQEREEPAGTPDAPKQLRPIGGAPPAPPAPPQRRPPAPPRKPATPAGAPKA